MKQLQKIAKNIHHAVTSPAGHGIQLLILISALLVFSIGMNYYQKHHTQPVRYGVSFSRKYANELGLDWKDAYSALLHDMEFRKFRLMSYWDLHEPVEDQYEFSNLDWQFEQAEKSGAQISLALGFRQPRWPECHIPYWAEGEHFNSELLEYLKVVVNRYKDSPALESYQLENEIANRSFGNCGEHGFDKELLRKETALIKSLDPDTTLIINASNQIGAPLIDHQADKTGFSIYRIANIELFGRRFRYHYYTTPALWHSFRAFLVETVTHSRVFIHELQLEPWGHSPTVNLTIDEQEDLMSPEDIARNIGFADKTGIQERYLWGGEWWYWRKQAFDDPSIWNTVKLKVEGKL